MYCTSLKIPFLLCLLEIIHVRCLPVWDPQVNKKSNPSHNYFHMNVPSERSDCVLPAHPDFGFWKIANKNHESTNTGTVLEYTILRIFCNETHILKGPSIVACLGGKWTPTIGRCLKTCPAIYSTPIMTVKCTTNGKEAINCTDAIHGTMARFSCASFYENSRRSMLPAICLDGRWSEEAPSCIPTCGKTSALRDPTLIINGQDATLEDFPWQVALYRLKDKELLCGGSLLNARMILTAAHCITDSQGHLLPKEDYVVAVGKKYRNFDDSRDSSHKQTSSIHEIFVPEQYQGFDQNYLADIALIATVKFFKLTAWVQPVCIDWQKNYDRLILDEKKKGVVSGWGYTRETGNSSEALRKLEVSVVPKKKCKKEVPEDFARYVTFDKLCAGYLNHSTSVCLGDSGGGLVFKYQDRYYIGGVVSSSPITDTPERGCNSQQYSLYTFVYNYSDSFILRNMLRFESSDVNCDGCSPGKSRKGCTLPKDLATKIANGSVVQERNPWQNAAYTHSHVAGIPTSIFCSGVLLNEKVLLTMRICVLRGSRKEDYKIKRDLFNPYKADYTDLGDILVIEDTAFIVVKKTFKTALSLGKTCDWIKIYPRGTLNQLKYYVFISNYVDKDGKSWDMLQGKQVTFELTYSGALTW